MLELLSPPATPDSSAEVARLNRIIQALMDRAERPNDAEASEFSHFQGTIQLEEQVHRRTAELGMALRENEKINRTLQESDARFRGLVNQSLVGIAIIEDGKFSYSNTRFGDIFGYGADEIRGMAPLTLSVGSFHQAFEESIGKLLSGSAKREERIAHGLRKNGDQIDVDLHVSVMEIGGRRVLIAMAMDVTERIRAEHEVLALQESLRDQSTRDALTGLYNRRYLEESLARELVLAERQGQPVSLIFGDLDHFKDVNDRYGHLAGDEVLRVFGATIKGNARGSDIYCRYGGEEFLLVLPGMTRDGAVERAEQVRRAIAAAPVPFGTASIVVTASFGVASFPRDGRSGDELIAAADRAMYFSKTTGRNRVSASAGPVEPGPGLAADDPFPGKALRTNSEAIPSAYDRLKSCMASADLGAWEIDLRTTQFVWDDTLRGQYGLGAGEADPDLEQWLGRVQGDDRAGVRAKVAACLSGTATFDAEFRVALGDGSTHWFHSFGRVFQGRDGVIQRASGVNLDITDIKRAQVERDQAGRDLLLLRALVDHGMDPMEVLDSKTLQFIDVNQRSCSDLGYSREELLKMKASDIDPEIDRTYTNASETELGKSGSVRFESVHRRKDGSTFPVEITLSRVTLDGCSYQFSVSQDITERNRLKQALQESELRSRSLIEATSDLIAIARPDGTITYINHAVHDILGYEPSDVIGRNYFDLVVPEDAAAAHANMERLAALSSESLRAERRIRHKDGSFRDLESIGRNLTQLPGVDGIVVSMRDMTARKVTEATLRDSELTLRTITGAVMDGVVMIDNDGKIAFWNEAAERILGYSPGEAMGQSVASLLAVAPRRDRFARELAHFLATGEGAVAGQTRELLALRKDGREVPVEVSASGVMLRGKRQVVGVLHDVTERNLQQHALARVNHALKALSAGNSAVVHAASEPALLQAMCRALVDVGGYRMAWVGFAEADAARTIRGAASAGEASDYVKSATNSWADGELGRGPAGRCIRTGQAQVARDIAVDPTMHAWHGEAEQHGYRSAVALPLTGADGVIGVLMIFAAEPDAFDADELALLSEMAGDLSYGITALHTRTANEDNLRRLERSMDSTVRALGSMVEVRDPYTAGHQRRVASLSVEIGKLLGFDEDRLRGLGVGATMHDIGKIVVPAEILSRPGKLSAAEFTLLKEHAAAGADIIAGVDFPWPVAEMIRQHHERLDGSGYPRGLKGDQILLEARIIAVADVVEAMSSHRPYRPSKGIDAALAVIAIGRGITFDSNVVDACLKAFRELGYRIPE